MKRPVAKISNHLRRSPTFALRCFALLRVQSKRIFISRNVRNEIYSKRAVVTSIDKKDFPLQNMERKKIFINENLTQARKRLFWLAKQKAKAKKFFLYMDHEWQNIRAKR